MPRTGGVRTIEEEEEEEKADEAEEETGREGVGEEGDGWTLRRRRRKGKRRGATATIFLPSASTVPKRQRPCVAFRSLYLYGISTPSSACRLCVSREPQGCSCTRTRAFGQVGYTYTIVIDQHIYPVVHDSFTITELHTIPLTTLLFHFLDKIVRLSIPNLYVWLLMFIGLFHHWCNILAEITRFGDRQFYLDWWNASSVGEYWRKWNLPIHYFLNRHVNKPLRRATQAPLIRFTNAEFFQSHPTVGNCFFWFVLCFSGQPLGILIYWYLWGVKHGTVQELDPRKIQIM